MADDECCPGACLGGHHKPPDLTSESGRETMALKDRIDLLRAELMQEPFLGISEASRSVTQAIHDLKLTVGWIRNTIALYEQRRAKGKTDEELQKGAKTFVSWIECLILAWRRGGHQEWQRVRRAQK